MAAECEQHAVAHGVVAQFQAHAHDLLARLLRPELDHLIAFDERSLEGPTLARLHLAELAALVFEQVEAQLDVVVALEPGQRKLREIGNIGEEQRA